MLAPEVHTDLVNTADGAELWGSQYSRKLDEITQLQSDITRDISVHLRGRTERKTEMEGLTFMETSDVDRATAGEANRVYSIDQMTPFESRKFPKLLVRTINRVESRTGAVTVVFRWACDSAVASSPQSGLA